MLTSWANIVIILWLYYGKSKPICEVVALSLSLVPISARQELDQSQLKSVISNFTAFSMVSQICVVLELGKC